MGTQQYKKDKVLESPEAEPTVAKPVSVSKPKYRRYRELEDRRRRRTAQVLTVLANIAGIYYIYWLIPKINTDVWYLSIPFVLAEIIALLSFDIYAAITWFLRFHRPQGPPATRDPYVDIFITVCREPMDIVARTMRAAADINYPNKKIYVLDDGRSEEVRALAEQHGCQYLSRETNEDAKAGNLNFGLAHSDGEIILTLDADQVSRPEMIQKTIGYFELDYIGFVQTAQDFYLPVSDPYGNADEMFYKIMQAGKDTDNSAFSCGSGVLYRRKALESIGGFSTWNLVEDVHTSLLLHDKGWRSVYHDHPLSRGTAPTEIWGVYKQRQQWCTDSLRMLFWDSSFKHSGLSLKQKLQYFHIGFSYLVSAFVMPFFYIIPIFTLFSGKWIINSNAVEYAVVRVIFLLLVFLAYSVQNYGIDVIKYYRRWCGLFPAFIYGTWIALGSKKSKPQYKVTAKKESQKARSAFPAVLPQMMLILGSAAAIIYAAVERTVPIDLYIVNSIWGLWVIWTLLGMIEAVLARKKMEHQT